MKKLAVALAFLCMGACGGGTESDSVSYAPEAAGYAKVLCSAAPSHDLVVVRMGRFRGDGPAMRDELNEALAGILSAVTAS